MKKITLFLLFISLNNFAQCWQKLSAGDLHTVGIAQNGTLWAWGLNSSGQLGDGTTVSKWESLNQSSSQTNWVQIATGKAHTLAVKSDGTLWAWGNNASGQAGLGTVFFINTPTQVGTDTNWSQVTASNNHSLAIKTNGTLWGWGLNTSGVLGDGTNIDKNTPVQIGAETDWIKIKTGINHTLGLKTNGTLFAWGLDNAGQLGNGGSNSNSLNPLQVLGGNIYSNMVCGVNFGIALKTDGTLWSWGSNSFGNLGHGNNLTTYTAPTQVGIETNWTKIAAGTDHFLALKSNNSLWACGRNHRGQLGNNSLNLSNLLIPINAVTTYMDVIAGNNVGNNGTAGFSFAVKTDGNLQAWGDNEQGQLGIGSRFNFRQIPQEIACPTSFTLGLNDFIAKEITIYPNPTNGIININTVINNNLEVEIFDLIGKKVGQFKSQNQVDISNYKRGIYLVKITDLDTKFQSTQKIIKQ